jgi:AICAR transformylase/IMP cyclohydrolase PurH (only IMP cyclohydrolase domain in Aful)
MAILKYKDFFENRKFVCASDAFFPFTDNIKLLLKLKCVSIIQPSGSINDYKIIDYAKKNKTSLYFVKNRVFKH